jgi:hypothetical protein
VLENQRLLSLDIALKETPARWWGVHKEQLRTGTNVSGYCASRFGVEQGINQLQKYDGQGAPEEHLEK